MLCFQVTKKLICINRDFSNFAFTPIQIDIASDIRDFLQFIHATQQLVSAEKTPTLSIVLPLYEDLIATLKILATQKPRISHAIQAAVDKLSQYLAISQGTRIYALAMGESYI